MNATRILSYLSTQPESRTLSFAARSLDSHCYKGLTFYGSDLSVDSFLNSSVESRRERFNTEEEDICQEILFPGTGKSDFAAMIIFLRETPNRITPHQDSRRNRDLNRFIMANIMASKVPGFMRLDCRSESFQSMGLKKSGIRTSVFNLRRFISN